ncbi:MAG: BolA/IbaG family iron-sulfur metabolism protein [Sedimenticola sp.]|nr:BolA/IbaG family iron-sulfur metabolism protein [Sedimenticola sp.]
MKQRLTTLIQEALQPQHLEVIDESHMHNVPKGAQSHFKVVVVSDQFTGLTLVGRHRLINTLAKPLFEGSLHALALHTMTPEEWEQRQGSYPQSPQCMGGSK